MYLVNHPATPVTLYSLYTLLDTPCHFHLGVFNPRRMREGYGSRSVCLSFCHSVILSVPALAATYLVYKCRLRCCRVPYGVANVCICLLYTSDAADE